MERQAPTKVLPVEMIAWRATFLIFQFTLVDKVDKFIPQSGLVHYKV